MTYVITEKTGQKKTITLAPDQKTSYHWEWGETVPSEDSESGAKIWDTWFDKRFLFRNQAKEVENEIAIASATRNYNEWIISVLSRSSPFIGSFSNKFDALLTLTPDCGRSSSNKFDYTSQCTVKIVDSIPPGLRTTDYVQLR